MESRESLVSWVETTSAAAALFLIRLEYEVSFSLALLYNEKSMVACSVSFFSDERETRVHVFAGVMSLTSCGAEPLGDFNLHWRQSSYYGLNMGPESIPLSDYSAVFSISLSWDSNVMLRMTR